MPTGREEIWRFTPLKRLRGLHADAPLDGTGVGAEYDAPDGGRASSRSAADSPLLGSSGFVPTDRIAAARLARGRAGASPSTVPADAELDRPVFVTLTGTDVEHATATPRRDHGRRAQPGDRRARASWARRPWPTTSRSSSATAPT